MAEEAGVWSVLWRRRLTTPHVADGTRPTERGRSLGERMKVAYLIWAIVATAISGIVLYFFCWTPAIIAELILLAAPLGGGSSGSSCSGGCDCDYSGGDSSGGSDE